MVYQRGRNLQKDALSFHLFDKALSRYLILLKFLVAAPPLLHRIHSLWSSDSLQRVRQNITHSLVLPIWPFGIVQMRDQVWHNTLITNPIKRFGCCPPDMSVSIGQRDYKRVYRIFSGNPA